MQGIPVIETNEPLKMEIKSGMSLYASSKQLQHLLYLRGRRHLGFPGAACILLITTSQDLDAPAHPRPKLMQRNSA